MLLLSPSCFLVQQANGRDLDRCRARFSRFENLIQLVQVPYNAMFPTYAAQQVM